MSAPACARVVARKIADKHEWLRDAIGVKNIAIIVEEAFEHHGIAQRLAARVSDGKPLRFEAFDPYEGLTAKQREFAEDMDLWTLEQIIIRVMSEIDRRRRKYLGGIKAMARGKTGPQSINRKRVAS